MNTVTVSSYEDLKGDRVSSALEKDTILMLLRGETGRSRVFRAEEWLWQEKPFETHARHETLVVGRILHEHNRSYLVTQLDWDDSEISDDSPKTAWIPKSKVRVYKPASSSVTQNTSVSFLGDYD